jgi:hypothetical protein
MNKIHLFQLFTIFTVSMTHAVEQPRLTASGLLNRFTHFVKPATSFVSNWYQGLSTNQQYMLQATTWLSVFSLASYFAYSKYFVHKKIDSVQKIEKSKKEQAISTIPLRDDSESYLSQINGENLEVYRYSETVDGSRKDISGWNNVLQTILSHKKLNGLDGLMPDALFKDIYDTLNNSPYLASTDSITHSITIGKCEWVWGIYSKNNTMTINIERYKDRDEELSRWADSINSEKEHTFKYGKWDPMKLVDEK